MMHRKFYHIASRESWHRHAAELEEVHAIDLDTGGTVLIVSSRRSDRFEAEGDVYTFPWLHGTGTVSAKAIEQLNKSPHGFNFPPGARVGEVIEQFARISAPHDPSK